MKKLFEQFLQEKRYLANLSPKTLVSYKQSYNTYQRVLGKAASGENSEVNCQTASVSFTKDTLKDFVIGMREAGLSPGACNVYIRSINSFLSWLHENGHTERLRIKQLPKPNTIIKIFTEAHIQALIQFR